MRRAHKYFNCSNDKISMDNRSGKKGPEPETVTTGTIDGKTYAFLAIERIGGIASYDITYTSCTYTGKTRTPSVTVKDASGKTLKKDRDNTVTYQTGRKYVGKYKVTIKGKGSYTGSKTVYFRINPKGTYVTGLCKGKKAFTVKWKKQSVQTSGYQIRYSSSSSMKNAKYYTIKSTKTTSKTISKLRSDRKYYVQVRTYKVVKGDRYYSSWSKMKSVRTR